MASTTAHPPHPMRPPPKMWGDLSAALRQKILLPHTGWRHKTYFSSPDCTSKYTFHVRSPRYTPVNGNYGSSDSWKVILKEENRFFSLYTPPPPTPHHLYFSLLWSEKLLQIPLNFAPAGCRLKKSPKIFQNWKFFFFFLFLVLLCRLAQSGGGGMGVKGGKNIRIYS